MLKNLSDMRVAAKLISEDNSGLMANYNKLHNTIKVLPKDTHDY